MECAESHWPPLDLKLTHYPGHSQDYLYFGVPLRGEFEVECELTSFGWREIQPVYSCLGVGAHHELGPELVLAAVRVRHPHARHPVAVAGQTRHGPAEHQLDEPVLIELRHRKRRNIFWWVQHPTAAAPGSSRTARQSSRTETVVSTCPS